MWLDPHADWTSKLYERLLARRIVMASGLLDDDAASRLSAQLLTLDAEQEDPIRLELQNLRAELPATLAVMGILDVLRVPVHACVSGEINGPALGVLVSCPQRYGYPNASFVLAEPKLHLRNESMAQENSFDIVSKVDIQEEGPREGFQIEPGPIASADKIRLIEGLAQTGLNHIQVCSFVNQRLVPGWADAENVVAGFRTTPGVHYVGLWFNDKGLERALAFSDKLTLSGSISLSASLNATPRRAARCSTVAPS